MGFEAEQGRIDLLLDNKPIALGSDAGKIRSKFNFLDNDPTAMRANASIFTNTLRVVTHPIHWGYSLRNHETVLYFFNFYSKKFKL